MVKSVVDIASGIKLADGTCLWLRDAKNSTKAERSSWLLMGWRFIGRGVAGCPLAPANVPTMTNVLSSAIAGGGALAVIGSMITPAFLILSAANLIASTMTRLARIVDTSRSIMREQERTAGNAAGRARLARYAHRATLVECSLGSFYMAIGLFVATSLAIAIPAATGHRGSFLPAWLTIAGAVLLFIGAVLLFAETAMSTRMLRDEIAAALD